MPVNQVKPEVSVKAKAPSSAKTTFLADTVAAQETDKFAQSLLKRLRETQPLAASPAKLEIKVGREISYRGMEGQAPEVSKLSPAAIAYLNAAIKTPQADPAQRGQADKALNRAVTIKVDNEVVFRLNKGVVETNKLQPELAQQISQAVKVDLQSAVEPVEATRLAGQEPSQPTLDQQKANAPRKATAKGTQEGEADHSVSGYKDTRTIPEATASSVEAAQFLPDPVKPVPTPAEQAATAPPETSAHFATVVQTPPTQATQQISQPLVPTPQSAPQQESNLAASYRNQLTEAGVDPGLADAAAKILVADQVRPRTGAEQSLISEVAQQLQPHLAKLRDSQASPGAMASQGQPQTPPKQVELRSEKAAATPPKPPPKRIQTVSALDIVEREVQKQPKGSVRQYLGQAVQALKAASQLAGAKVQQRVENLPAQVQVTAGKVQQQLKQLPQQATKIPEVVRDRHIADTALQLLEKYGTRNDQGLSYQAADYTIQATGKNTYSISDNQGKDLMRFKQNFFGPQTLSSQMSQRQQKDFARAGSQIQIQGGTSFLPADPGLRLRQLQGLAPAADVSLARDVKNIAAVTSVQNVLQSLGRDRYQNDHYRFQQRGNALTVTAKDGRGEILSVKNGGIQGNLKSVDISYLRQLDRQVSQELASKSPAQEPAKQPELVH